MEFICKECGRKLPSKEHYLNGLCNDCHACNLILDRFREEEYGGRIFNSKTVADKLELHHKMTEQYNFNQKSNFLYHFVNKFTDTEISIEAIREELENLTTNDNNSDCGCKPEQCKMIQGKCKNLAYR